jgi:NADH:ubiquinone oxidoreductase subunit F (NADH-binding)
MPEGTSDLPAASNAGTAQSIRGFETIQAVRAQGANGAQSVMDAARQARLRGRGGAGMLAADKWQIARAAVAKRGGPAFLVCNAYDADPKALVAATLLARQPALVLEGVMLAAHAVGAREAYLYVRATNREGHVAINETLHQAQDAGLLANLIVHIVGVDVGFMGGEESTMLEVIKGRRAMAQQRPPYPAQSGLSELPTVVANVETLAQLVGLMRNGAAYAKTGTQATGGTKLVSVYDAAGTGKLVEVPFGMTIAAILQQAGIATDGARGVVVGGPEGGVLPPNLWNTPFDYESLQAVGAIVGSGTIEVLGAQTCLVDWARERSQYLAKQSCGKCIPCRSGVKRIEGTLEGIMSDVGVSTDLDLLAEFADYVPAGSLCGFGWHATNPLKTALKYFAEDFQQHLQGTCPTGTCVPLRSHRFNKNKVL